MTTNAPKRIWANCTTPLATRKSGTWTEDPYGQLFIRADLSPSPEVVKELVEALRKLHHAVCGETGFAESVRMHSGMAYPWPALDEADEAARAALAKWEAGE